MMKLSQMLNNNSYSAVMQMSIIYKVWYSIIMDNLKEVTTPYNFDPYTKTLTIKVYDNMWYSNLQYLVDDFKEKLNENGLTISKIIFKYTPKYEKIKKNNEICYEITKKCQNYIENSVKKIDNKNIAEKFKEYLLNYFKHNSFESWIIK
ncbi:MAG: DUF721 domain-containing protein [Mucispirillum sp.]|nr:DUF721 domain-containing protein [Mucispirillum sp.]